MPRGQYEVTNLRYQPRLWDSYPTKSPNLRHHQTRSQNKNRAEVAGCGPAHPQPEAGRRGQPELEGGNCVQREASSTKLQAGFIANQDFLGFWTVNIRREDHRQRSPPHHHQKRHMAHLRRCTCCTPRKPSSWDGGGDKSQPSTGGDSTRRAPGHLSSLDLGRTQNAGPAKSAPLWSTREPEPEQLIPGMCMKPRAHLRQFPAEQPRA